MPRLALRYAALAIASMRTRALLAGLLLGLLVQALAAQREGGGFALAMALVMVGSGSAAFVLHALATSGGVVHEARRSPPGCAAGCRRSGSASSPAFMRCR